MIKTIRILAILNAIAFLLSFAVANLGQFGALGLPNTMATVSAHYESYFTPSGATFAIWGLIYLALFAFCGYHLFHAFTKHADERVNQDVLKINTFFIVNTLATTAWVYAFLGEYLFLSVVCMFIQLFSLLAIHVRLDLFNSQRAFLGKLFSQFPLSIYFAWICIATIANVTVYFVSVSWNGFGIQPHYWSILMIGIAALISLFMVFVRKNVFFGLVVLWALYGIISKRQVDLSISSQEVVSAAWGAFFVILISMVIQLFKAYRRKPNVH